MSYFFNLIFSLFILLVGLRMIIHSYVKPDYFYSTTMKGYLGGILFILMGTLSLFGKFNLYEMTTEAVKNSLKLKGENGALSFAVFVAIVCSIFLLTYYRPDKFIKKYKIANTNFKDKVNVLSDYLLFYLWLLFVLLFLVIKIVK